MKFEREGDKVIISLPQTMSNREVDDLIDYIKFTYITRKANRVSEEEFDQFMAEVKEGRKGWWEANKDRLLGNREVQ